MKKFKDICCLLQMRIVGLRVEKYIGQSVEGHNCDFEYKNEEHERHILFGYLGPNNIKIAITLWTTCSQCYSGWTTASHGHLIINKVDHFGNFTHVPKDKELLIDDKPFNFDRNYNSVHELSNLLFCSSLWEKDESFRVDNKVFYCSDDGGDQWYPSGRHEVYMDLFVQTPRHIEHRPVWIFTGPSNIGKSYLGNKLQDLSVYETDSNEKLPDTITADVVVLGNKYKFTPMDVTERLFGDVTVIVVSFDLLESFLER